MFIVSFSMSLVCCNSQMWNHIEKLRPRNVDGKNFSVIVA